MKTSVVSALLLACVPAAALAMDQPTITRPDALKWAAAPPALPPGSEVAVLAGDPGGDGPYVLRVRMPDGYKVAPHTHPTAENVTVLTGTMNFGMGGSFDPSKGQAVPVGGFFRADKGMEHYSWTSGPTMIQVHGMGPFTINYVNPADDPRNAAGKASETTGSK